ncbi:MAG: SatD family protein [Candidatus Eiseniibacteriota bacterium]
MGVRRSNRTDRFVAILGDLVASREVENRARLQAKLKTTLRQLAAREPLRSVRVAGPEIAAGDEVQLLLRVREESLPGHAVLGFLRDLTEALRPTQIAFGVGLGGLSTKVSSAVREMDGPCFHRARRALQVAKRGGRWAVVEGFAPFKDFPPFDDSVNSMLRLTGDIRRGWTDRQREIIQVRGNLSLQKDVARKLGVSKSVVSEVLQAARLDAVLEAEEAAVALLNQAARPTSFFYPQPWTGDDR